MLSSPILKAQQESGIDIPDCAALSLHEYMMNKTDDPEYTEGVIKASLASMYTGSSVIWHSYITSIH